MRTFDFLSRVTRGKSLVSMYHATLSQETKSYLHQQFAAPSSDLRCLVCTVAFGMVRKLAAVCVEYISYRHLYVGVGHGHRRHTACCGVWPSRYSITSLPGYMNSVSYSGFISREKLLANIVDLLLCAKIIFANTVSPIRCGSSPKIQSAKFICARH